MLGIVMNLQKNDKVVRLTTPVKSGNSGFSLRGVHMVAMFARTPVAKEFRRWVLDILIVRFL